MELFRIVDLGCKVNRYDGEVVRAELRRFGLRESGEQEAADLVVLNACAVTDRAVQKGRQALRRLRRQNPGARLLVTGCMTPADRDGYERIDAGLLAVRQGDRLGLRRVLEDFMGGAAPAASDNGRTLDGAAFASRTRAFLKVQDGCDAACSFCVIPRIRGGSRSRPRHEVLAEAAALLERGFRELVLCGVHLGHYGRDSGDDLAGLVLAVARLPGEFRVRLSSLEVNEVDRALARVLASSGRFAPHLHVPLQSGDDGVLSAMRRPYTWDGYRRRIEDLCAALPGVALTTDVIAGFPGESEQAFRRTLAAVDAARFAKVHVFPFSPRAGTDAARLPERVPAPVVRGRVAELLRAERRLREEGDRALIGANATVLVEAGGGAFSSGLCERGRRFRLPAGMPTSTFIRCRVAGRAGDDLLGEPCP
ncbi:MAG: tRNA (N(6)-L-threonylcarbamoyladenosine(37)-C(2))-methylthiotransferase MtaB [Planctomycetes bacterium]|nr:tRNA (N(6)-L-threonylcarbamoyladenosine(37)-C(2))-methylthiotransferase MtaB [Planctomycetota bacterium]